MLLIQFSNSSLYLLVFVCQFYKNHMFMINVCYANRCNVWSQMMASFIMSPIYRTCSFMEWALLEGLIMLNVPADAKFQHSHISAMQA